MIHGTTEAAIQLAKQRFAALHPFDLADETWEQLFSDHRPGFVLEAIRQTSKKRDRPEIVYQWLLNCIAALERERTARTTWPPPDVIPKN